ncbi:ATP-binding protein [Kiloniella laminariae]|uniref:histidine kinase n=1 Tax=Kiloniella laminariae TaxID=454162 RepID=A0ABT4LEY3_9PROT|nr:ATP-binding protein [Kiloniella laminariae]MCZ4279639.1 ATP-binding protein [Kiloniella laminariae]
MTISTGKVQPRRLALHHILFIGFTIISTLPVFFLATWAQKSAQNREMAIVEDKHLLFATNIASRLEDYVADTENLFRVLAQSMLTDLPSSQISELLQGIDFNHICLIAPDGTQLKHVEKNALGEVRPEITPDQLTRLGPELLLAGSKVGEIIFSRVLPDENGAPSLFMIRAENNGNYTVANLSTGYLSEVGKSVAFGKKGHAVIVDQTGQVLAHPNPAWRNSMEDLSKIKPVALMLAGKTGITTFFSPFIQAEMIAAYTTVPRIGWGVMIPQPLSELQEETGELHLAAIFITLFGIIAAAMTSWWLARYLTLPVQSVVKAAGEIRAGHHDTRVPAFSSLASREADELIAAFNSMIEEIEKVELQLKQSEQRFRDYASSASDWFWEIDSQGRLIWEIDSKQAGNWGLNFNDVKGRTREELAGDLMSDEQWRPYRKALAEGSEIKGFEYCYLGKDGVVHHAEVDGKPLFDSEGKYIGHRGAASDITARKQIEEKLQQALAEAERTSEAKSEFLATMSHEFRTPLNAILGFSEMIHTRYFGPLGSDKYGDYARHIHESGAHLLALINDILDIASVEAGKRTLLREDIDIKVLFSKCLSTIEKSAEERDIALSLNLQEPLPLLQADTRSLTQITLNLLSNAVKFTNRGGSIALSARVCNGQMRLSVQDTGIGVASEMIPVITEPFAQANSNSPRARQGNGLGLYIVKSLVEAQGGEMTIESALGKGTTITILFPLEQEGEQPPSRDDVPEIIGERPRSVRANRSPQVKQTKTPPEKHPKAVPKKQK